MRTEERAAESKQKKRAPWTVARAAGCETDGDNGKQGRATQIERAQGTDRKTQYRRQTQTAGGTDSDKKNEIRRGSTTGAENKNGS
jgi:hypothetical protein